MEATIKTKKVQGIEKEQPKTEAKKGRLSAFRDKYPDGIIRIVNMSAVLR
jgi:hypothetical protein